MKMCPVAGQLEGGNWTTDTKNNLKQYIEAWELKKKQFWKKKEKKVKCWNFEIFTKILKEFFF